MDDTILRSGNLVVTPVTTEFHLAKAYLAMLEEGTLEIVFHQGVPTLRDFLAEFMTAGRRVTLSCFREIPDATPEFAGLGWVYGTVAMGKFTRAETGMWFSRKQTSKRDNLAFGKLMLELFFTRYNIDALFGVTPEENRLALRYSRKLGFGLNGPIPDYCVWEGELAPGWISHLSRSDWLERNRPVSPATS